MLALTQNAAPLSVQVTPKPQAALAIANQRDNSPLSRPTLQRELLNTTGQTTSETLQAQSTRIRFMAQPNSQDSHLLTGYLQHCLGNRTKGEVERLKEMFKILFGTEFPSLEQLAKSTLTGADADVALELIEGFDSNRSAEAIFRAVSQQVETDDGECFLEPDTDRLRRAILTPDDDYRSVRNLSSIILAFEFPYQQSLYSLFERVMPDFLQRHPALAQQLESRTTPRLRATPDMSGQISRRFQWRLLRLMPESVQSRIYVISRDAPASERRRSLEALLRVRNFIDKDLMTQQMILQVFLALRSPQSRHRFIFTLADRPHVLLKLDEATKCRAIDELFAFLFAQLHPSSQPYRAHILEVMVLALRGPWQVRLPAGLEWLLKTEISQPLLDRRWSEFCRIVREIASRGEASWYKQPLTSSTLWISKHDQIDCAA